jgi:hypothetical protein
MVEGLATFYDNVINVGFDISIFRPNCDPKTLYTSLANVAPAFLRPKGILRWQKVLKGVIKAVLGIFAGFM